MSNVTFDFFSIKTVPPDYSWDEGTPRVEYPNDKLVTDAFLLTGTDSTYIGYAPYTSISLSSFPGTPSLSAVAIRRVTDFGDYYNTDSNFTSSPTLSNEVYCHNYIMPGLYTIKFTKTEWVDVATEDYKAFSCMERYCLEWTWNKRNCTDPNEPQITWNTTLSTQDYEKRWNDRPDERCDDVWANSGGVYIQPEIETPQLPFNWQWYNFLCSSPSNPRNNPITWNQSGFQDANQLIWSGVSGPCLEYATEKVTWLWNNVSCNLSANPLAKVLSWDDTKCDSSLNKTWDQTGNGNCSQKVPTLSAKEQTIVKEMMLRVIEIPPVAYLSAIDLTPGKISPLTVRLTPRFIKAGSFPIEKIVWDLGDGSPLLTQRRWSPDSEEPFVFSNVFNIDWKDPRNFDVIYTYRKLPDSKFSYYPSLTAYASSTGTSDCTSTIVGPLKLPVFDGASVTLLQNELTDNGKVIVGEINNGLTVWKIDN